MFFETLIYKSIFRRYYYSNKINIQIKQNKTTIDIFVDFLNENEKIIYSYKNFFLIHFDAPHSPFRDEKCSVLDKNISENPKKFPETIKCVENKTKFFIENIFRLDPSSIILIVGDHGSKISYLNGEYVLDKKNSLEVISAIYPPEKACKKFDMIFSRIFIRDCLLN